MGTVRGLVVISVLLVGCKIRDQMAPQTSPDGRFTLTPSLHKGNNVRLTVQERSSGTVIDDVKTDDTNAMKWVTGWIDDTSYLYWGGDTGAHWVHHIDGTDVTESPLQGPAACDRLEQLFNSKYAEARSNCLRYEPSR